MLSKRTKIDRAVPSRCVEIFTNMTTSLIDQSKAFLDSGDIINSGKYLKFVKILPLICLSYNGPLCFDCNGQRLSKRHIIRKKIDMIIENKWEEFTVSSLGLLQEDSSPGHKGTNRNSAPGKLSSLEEKAISLCAKGDYSKAYSTLFPGTPAPPDMNTFERLANLHPSKDTSDQWSEELWNFVSDTKIEITVEQVRDYIYKADHLVSPGPFKNTIDLYKQLIGSPNSIPGTRYVTAVTWLQNSMANDILPPDYIEMLRSASLFALVKDDQGNVRPIAMGDTDRKMNASLILTNIERAAKSFLSGSQYGMDSMGTEKIIHSINYLRDQHKTWDTVGMDQKNAFNVVFRTLMATKIMYQFPQLMNYFRTFYFHSSSLVFNDPQTQAMIEFFSCEGVQQGDPLAPFLFCLASLDYVKTIQNLVDTGIAPAFF